MRIAALPTSLSWDPPAASVETDGHASLRVVAPGRTDMFHDPGGGARVLNAPRALAPPPSGDFQLWARVTVDFRQTYDAGALVVWAGETHWAKLCFERSPQGEAMAVSVVTREYSDDANAVAVPAGQPLWLRMSRLGPAWAFHARPGGNVQARAPYWHQDANTGPVLAHDRSWSFVRHFRLDGPSPVAMGFEAQSPLGDGCSVTFDQIGFAAATLADLRSGV